MGRSIPLARLVRPALIGAACACAAACGTVPDQGARPGAGEPFRTANLKPYEVGGRVYHPKPVRQYEEEGLASWYSYPKGQRRTAMGEPFDGSLLTAAHKTLPLPCVVEVTNLENGRSVRVRVNDRGPFEPGRIIDLSPAAAERLGFMRQGVARVRVKLLGQARMADSGEVRLAETSTRPHGGLQVDDPRLY